MSGLSSQLGYSANESAYGTETTVTVFPRLVGSVEHTGNRVQGSGIESGGLGPVASLYSEVTSAAVGSISGQVEGKGHLGLFELLMGGSSSAQQGGTSAYLHTFTLADPVGKFRTFQVGRPARGGTVIPGNLVGGKISSAEFTCDKDGGILESSYEIDGKSFNNTTALASVSYLSGAPVFTFNQMTVKMGTYASESSVDGVRGMSVTVERAMDSEDYVAGNAGAKNEPNVNDYTSITGSIQADWLAKTTFEDLAVANTSTSLVWEFVSATAVDTGYYWTWRITVPGIHFEPASQGVDGPAELVTDWAWTWRYDGTNLPTIEVISDETTVP